jgi:acetyl-CoA carboxylase biotin carboxyl carrier protein
MSAATQEGDALEALLVRGENGRITLGAPEVGLWREGPALGRVLQPGEHVGRIETLGVFHPVVVPQGAAGVVVERTPGDRARLAVGYGAPLVVLDPEAAGALAESAVAEAGAGAVSGLVLTAPMGGRFYARPGPGKPAFVAVGDVIETGHTVAIVEVMKTFNRIQYGGHGLPSPARVKAILRKDDEDVSAGDPLLEVEDA